MAADLPPIPSTAFSPLGPVSVVLVADLTNHDGECALGIWCPEERAIKLRPELHPVTAWATLWHEIGHVWFWDSGTGLSEEDEERACDALSAQMVALMLFGGLAIGGTR